MEYTIRQGSQLDLDGTLIGVMQLAPTRAGVMKCRLLIRRADIEPINHVFELGDAVQFDKVGLIKFVAAHEPDAMDVRSGVFDIAISHDDK